MMRNSEAVALQRVSIETNRVARENKELLEQIVETERETAKVSDNVLKECAVVLRQNGAVLDSVRKVEEVNRRKGVIFVALTSCMNVQKELTKTLTKFIDLVKKAPRTVAEHTNDNDNAGEVITKVTELIHEMARDAITSLECARKTEADMMRLAHIQLNMTEPEPNWANDGYSALAVFDLLNGTSANKDIETAPVATVTTQNKN